MAGDEGEVTVLGHWGSPFVTRVRLALRLKGVRYEYVEEDLRSKSDLLLRCNPVHRAVPVLIHRGRPVCESQAILQYVDEAFGPPTLLPADPHERAVARFWAAYFDDELGAPWDRALRAGTEEERAAWMKKVVDAADGLERGLGECTDGGRKGCFFGGESVGYVDVVVGGTVSYVHAVARVSGERLFQDEGRTPLLAAWLRRFSELDAAVELLQDVDRVVEYMRFIHAKNAAKATAN
ncbi:hypothetical protein ZWY2020_031319 [Hordeum vulgare]|nr:hypothetical protein ZWY2020_031319 [Hordeum vulgare]